MLMPPKKQSFHTTCEAADALPIDVPPALTTFGWDPGSSTASWVVLSVGKQSSDPESPDAAIMVCPCRAMRAKIPFSVWRSAWGRSASHAPQLVVTTWATLSLAIRLNRSNAWASLPLGPS